MKALSIVQPWAWLIISSHKPVENRIWAPPKSLMGQRIVVHASKKRDTFEYTMACKLANGLDGIKVPSIDALHYGAAIGTAVVRDVVEHHASPWFFGPFGIVLDEAELWPKPVSIRGQLGLWTFPNDLVPEGVRIL